MSSIDAIADQSSDEGSAIAFNATYSDPGILDTHTIEWDFGDGSTARDTLSPTHTYTDNGPYNASLTITDDEGAATRVDFIVTVNNVAPVITEINQDSNINEGETANFRAIASDPGNDELTYTWDFGDASESAIGQDVDHTYPDDGNYDVTLTVRDDDGGSTNQSFEVLVNNLPPTIIDVAIQPTITDQSTTTFSANATDPGDDTLTYTWDLGDGNRLQGQNIEHVYEFAGSYTITLTVADDQGAEATETREIQVEPSIRANLQFVQNRLKSQIFLDGVKVEEIRGRQNQPVPTDFERIIISAIDSPDVPNAKTDVTFLDNGEGIGVTDGDDYNSSTKKRLDGDEALLIEINPAADYNSAKVATFILDRLKSGTANGGVVKVVALLENQVVGEASFNLDNYRDQFTFSNEVPFNSLQLMAADNDTKFTFREVELETTNYRLPVRDNLRLEQNGLDLTVYENGVEIEAIAAIADQPLVPNFERLDIAAVKDNAAVQVLVDNSGFGVTNQRLDENETLTIALQPTPNYNAANNLLVEFSEATAGEMKLTFLHGGLVVQESTVTIEENSSKVEVPSNLPFDTVQITAANTSFAINAIEFATVSADNRFTQLTFYQDQLESKIFENGYLVEQYSGRQNQPLTDSMSRLSLEVIDSNDGSQTKVDRTFLDRGEGIGVTDGEDGNSSRKKRIDRDEVLEISINPTINYNSATSAEVTVDQVKAISGSSQGGVVKLAAYWQGDLVVEESFNIATTKDKITLDSAAPFDKLAVMAGDNNTQFTFRIAQFTTTSSWIESLTVNEGELVNLSVPSDLNAQEFTWDLGEGTIKSGKQISHRFEDDGDYAVTLNAKDTAGSITNRTMSVRVNNVAPTITEIQGERTIDLGTSLSLTALAQDPGNDTLSYSWDLGDASELITGTAINYDFTDPGTYTVTLRVNDDDGGTDTQSIEVVVRDPNAPQGEFFNLKAEGKVRINGASDFQGEVLNTLDDTRIYAGKGFTINGNQTFPVLRDDAGNPIQENGKLVLIDQGITVSPDYNESNAGAIQNNYVGIIPPQVIEPLTVTLPEHDALINDELTARVAPGTTSIPFNPQQNPLNNPQDWADRFPAPGTVSNPTLVTVTNGGLNIPSGVDLANYVIIVENGDLNFNGNGHNLDNVVLINRNGSINLAAVESNNLAIFASNTININRDARFGGDTLIAAGSNNSNIHFDGATTSLDSASNLEVVSQGNIIFNSSSITKGNFIAAKNFTTNGNSRLLGSIQVKGDITINSGIELQRE
ncbi:MAG: PKD domain-containing protein [Cyanobacteria bacterium J06558_2]